MIWNGWFMHLTDELILTFYWCHHDLQPNILVFLVKEASKQVRFGSNWGVHWQNMARLEWKHMCNAHPAVHTPH